MLFLKTGSSLAWAPGVYTSPVISRIGIHWSKQAFLVGWGRSTRFSSWFNTSAILRHIQIDWIWPLSTQSCVAILPGYGQIPFTTVGDSAFPPRAWLLKAYPDTTRCPSQKNFNNKLRSARVVSEHAHGMLKGWWRLLCKKTECRRSNVKAIIMCWIALVCIHRNDPCSPRVQTQSARVKFC